MSHKSLGRIKGRMIEEATFTLALCIHNICREIFKLGSV